VFHYLLSSPLIPTPFFRPCPLFVYSVDLRVGRGTRTTLAEQIFDLRFRGFSVGDGGGYYMGPIQPILFIFRVSV